MCFSFSCCKKEDKQNEQNFSRNHENKNQLKYETIDNIEKTNFDTKDYGNDITNMTQNKTIDNNNNNKNNEKKEENNENFKIDVLKSLTYNDIKGSKNINIFNCRKSDDDY